MLAAQYGEHSKRAFRYKELAHRKEMADEAKRQFDVSAQQQQAQFQSQQEFDYATQRRDSKQSLAGFIFNK
jgi:hypothetical protein